MRAKYSEVKFKSYFTGHMLRESFSVVPLIGPKSTINKILERDIGVQPEDP